MVDLARGGLQNEVVMNGANSQLWKLRLPACFPEDWPNLRNLRLKIWRSSFPDLKIWRHWFFYVLPQIFNARRLETCFYVLGAQKLHVYLSGEYALRFFNLTTLRICMNVATTTTSYCYHCLPAHPSYNIHNVYLNFRWKILDYSWRIQQRLRNHFNDVQSCKQARQSIMETSIRTHNLARRK